MILAYNGITVRDIIDLVAEMVEPRGTKAALQVFRDGKVMTVPLTLRRFTMAAGMGCAPSRGDRKMRNTFRLWAGLGLTTIAYLLVLASSSSAGAARYVDPRGNLRGYKKWCGSVGGQYDYNGGNIRCIPGAGTGRMNYGGYNFGGYNPYQQMFGIIGNAIGSSMRCAMDPECNGTNRRRRETRRRLKEQRRREREQARLRGEHLRREFEQAAKERREKEEEQRRKLEAARERIFGVLKGGIESSEPFRLRTPEGTVRLELKSMKVPSAPSSEQGREDCTAYIIQKAEEAGGQGNFSEASYLSKQAERMISSGAAEVQCPQNAVARAGGGRGFETFKSRNLREKTETYAETKKMLKTHSKLYGELYRRADAQREKWVEKSDAIDGALNSVEKAKAAWDAVGERLAELEAQNARAPGAVPPNALAEARARLDEAEGALRSENEHLADARRELARIGEEMKKTHEIFEEAKGGPGKWGTLLRRLNLGT